MRTENTHTYNDTTRCNSGRPLSDSCYFQDFDYNIHMQIIKSKYPKDYCSAELQEQRKKRG
jgi:hypothetical protein